MVTLEMLLENTRNFSVLYVEDDKELSSNTEELFSLYFKSVDVAFNGYDGFEKYKNFYNKTHSYYDLVITDISMPQLSGLEMSREILAKNELQSIIVITAHNTTTHLFEAISLGIAGFMTKPLNNEDLKNTLYRVSKSIFEHQLLNFYIQQVDTLNIELEEKNSVLYLKNQELEKSIRILDTVLYKEKEESIQSKSIEVKELSEEEEKKNEDIKNQITQLITDDLFELKEILNEIDVVIIEIINHLDTFSLEKLECLVKLFSRYSAILNYYTFFSELSLSMSNFSQIMRDTPLPLDLELRQNIFTFLETFVYVLSKWQDDLASGDESKLNQLDASIISDMYTITNMWTQKVEEVSEDDLDSIFDF